MCDTGESAQILSAEKLIEILRKIEKTDNVELLEHQLGSTTAKGENWNSSLVAIDFKARVNGSDKEYHWVGKFPPTDPERKTFQEATMMAEKEARVYAEYFPALKKFIADSVRDTEIKLAIPNCPYAELDEREFYFFLENLKKSGFSEEFDKQQGLDLPHTHLALDELAKLHAASHAYIMSRAKDSSLEDVLKENEILTRDYGTTEPTELAGHIFKVIMKATLKNIKIYLKAIEEPGEDFVGPFERYLKAGDSPHYYRGRHVSKDSFNVLVHNDFWFNNLLFRYKNENGEIIPKEISILDFALGCWSNPAVDLSCFFVMSLTPEMRKSQEKELLKYYHSKLMTYLKIFGVENEVYTFEQLQIDYRERLVVGLFFFLNFPFIWLPKNQNLDQADMAGEWKDPGAMMEMMGEKFLEKLRADPDIKKRMRGNVLEAIEKGIFV